MRVICMSVVIALALVATPPARASDRIPQRSMRVDKPPLPEPMPQIVEGECPGLEDAAGCYIGPAEETVDGRVFETGAVFTYDRRERFVKLHELGHAFDQTMMDTRERNRFLRFTRQRNLYWTWYDGFDTPAEQFADAYANCRMRHEPGVTLWEAGYDYYPTAKQHRRICASITRAGRDPGYPPTVDEEVAPF